MSAPAYRLYPAQLDAIRTRLNAMGAHFDAVAWDFPTNKSGGTAATARRTTNRG